MGGPCLHLCSGAGRARRYRRPVSDYQRILVVSTQADAAEVARVRAEWLAIGALPHQDAFDVD